MCVIPVKKGIQKIRIKYWIPAGVYPDGNRDTNDEERGCPERAIGF